MTPTAIRDGFEHLRDDASMLPLADAAVCRSESDWLVGINGTRAMTAFNSKTGGFHLTTVGRVQTPTLAILVEREERIKNFVPKDYWEIHGTFGAKAGEYAGRWFDEKFAKKEGETDLRPERVWDGGAGRSHPRQMPGQARHRHRREQADHAAFAAALRSDQLAARGERALRFLGQDHPVAGPGALRKAQGADLSAHRFAGACRKITSTRSTTRWACWARRNTPPSPTRFAKSGWVRPNKRIFNNAKVSDHFAIIPTSLAPKHLNEMESKLYDMVTKRFLAVFYPAAEFLVTTRITRVEGEPFKSEGKVLVNAGWMAVYGKEAQTDDTPTLVPVQANESVKTINIEVQANQTKPPPRFTEATLLGAMESAGKLVEDEELREAMREKGLGTPATRAQIIEGLIYEKYVLRQGRELQPTAKAFSLIALLRGLQIPELSSPELTGDWEFKLLSMARGQMKRADFMQEIADMTREIVAKAKRQESDTVPGRLRHAESALPQVRRRDSREL